MKNRMKLILACVLLSVITVATSCKSSQSNNGCGYWGDNTNHTKVQDASNPDYKYTVYSKA